jgi:hypothetical protein
MRQAGGFSTPSACEQHGGEPQFDAEDNYAWCKNPTRGGARKAAKKSRKAAKKTMKHRKATRKVNARKARK